MAGRCGVGSIGDPSFGLLQAGGDAPVALAVLVGFGGSNASGPVRAPHGALVLEPALAAAPGPYWSRTFRSGRRRNGFSVNQLIFESAGAIDTEWNVVRRGNYADAEEMGRNFSQDGSLVWRGAQFSGLAVPIIAAARDRSVLDLRFLCFRRRGCSLHPLPRHRQHQPEGMPGCAWTSGALPCVLATDVMASRHRAAINRRFGRRARDTPNTQRKPHSPGWLV